MVLTLKLCLGRRKFGLIMRALERGVRLNVEKKAKRKETFHLSLQSNPNLIFRSHPHLRSVPGQFRSRVRELSLPIRIELESLGLISGTV